MSFQRILIAVDDSPIAAHAAEVGADLARALGALLAFVHVVDPGASVTPDTGVPAAEQIAWAEQDGKHMLTGFQQRASHSPASLAFVTVGKATDQIVQTAKEWSADVIVIGSHGRRGVDRALFGSVAEGVMRHATCSVLVARASR